MEEDLTPEQLQGLNMHYVKTIEELLSIALPTNAGRGESKMPKSASRC